MTDSVIFVTTDSLVRLQGVTIDTLFKWCKGFIIIKKENGFNALDFIFIIKRFFELRF